ncbi:MAG: glycosyltransferase, partial [Patescibacteria group bacterium]|nr:glycosyltransferase [Patescibacteria group bacterium]
MDLSIIIVSWNVREKLRKNLESLFNSQTSNSFEVFVVDNNSLDGSGKMIKEEFPNVECILNNENLGFAKANNQAIKKAKGKYILLLNPDMLVFPETIEDMLTWAKNNQQATVSGCKLISENYQIISQIRRFPKLFDQLMIVLKVPHVFPGVLNKHLRKDFDYSKDSKVDS